MPDITMCQATNCERSSTCKRHTDSGTVPCPWRQSYAGFVPEGCVMYWEVVETARPPVQLGPK